MSRTFFFVNQYCADDTLWETLSAYHPTRKEAEARARKIIAEGTLVRPGHTIKVDEILDVESPWPEDYPDGMDDLEYGEMMDYLRDHHGHIQSEEMR